MKYIIIRIISVYMFLVIAYKWGDLNNWKKYQATMYFFGMGDLIYVTVFNYTPLWYFPSNFLVPPIDELLLIFGCFFPTALAFLSNYPRRLINQIAYNSMWIGLYMVLELINLKLGTIEHYNRWDIWWSLLHNTIQFPLIALHHKKPILAWIIGLVCFVLYVTAFNVPIMVHI